MTEQHPLLSYLAKKFGFAGMIADAPAPSSQLIDLHCDVFKIVLSRAGAKSLWRSEIQNTNSRDYQLSYPTLF